MHIYGTASDPGTAIETVRLVYPSNSLYLSTCLHLPIRIYTYSCTYQRISYPIPSSTNLLTDQLTNVLTLSLTHLPGRPVFHARLRCRCHVTASFRPRASGSLS